MSVETKVQDAARVLANQFRAQQLYALEDSLVPSDLDEAYAIQREYQNDISRDQGPIAGYKLAHTTAAPQQANNVSDPALGIMLANNIRQSPATLTAADFVQLGLECEVAVRIGADLPPSGAPYDRDKVSAAIASLTVAFEIIDIRRTPGQDPNVQFMTGVAGNIFNAGVVLGEPVSDWQAIDLPAAHGSMTINGDGHGSDVMGHPLEPLVWLANKLSEHGQTLTAGMVIITGSIVSPKIVEPGDTASIMIDGLGSAELTVV